MAGKDREITKEDVARVIDAARGVQIPQDHEVIHVVPREFAVDGQDGVADPVGMVGARLEADVHVVTAPVAVTQNIVTCMNKAGIEVVQLVLEQFAAAEAVLTQDEKELGIALVDIGGGTTEVAVYQKGAIAHTAVIPIGGDHFTNDLAVVLRAPITDAERIKKKYGCALRSAVGEDEMVEVPMVGGRAPKLCPRTTLSDILQPRAEELLGLIHEDLQRLGLDKEIRSGVVLTGGGAELEGIVEIAEGIFDGPVRRGVPAGRRGPGRRRLPAGVGDGDGSPSLRAPLQDRRGGGPGVSRRRRRCPGSSGTVLTRWSARIAFGERRERPMIEFVDDEERRSDDRAGKRRRVSGRHQGHRRRRRRLERRQPDDRGGRARASSYIACNTDLQALRRCGGADEAPDRRRA